MIISKKKIYLKVSDINKGYDLEATSSKTFLKDLKRFFSSEKKYRKQIEVLSDCNMVLEEGESLALIGVNGSGKSTFLKILSKISTPDSGSVLVNESIASLLSLTSGLEAEFTGHENIYFLGSALGMTKQEISNQYEKIIQFSELGKFINTPLKRYSAGMKIRLAFSIASNLSSKIILLDEILVLIDRDFKEKCIQKLRELVDIEKKSIIFVSHEREFNKKFCNSGIVLNKGIMSQKMSINDAYNYYDSINKSF